MGQFWPPLNFKWRARHMIYLSPAVLEAARLVEGQSKQTKGLDRGPGARYYMDLPSLIF